MGASAPNDVHVTIRAIQGAGFTLMWEPPGRMSAVLHTFTAIKDGQKWTATGEDPLQAVLHLLEQLDLPHPD